MSGSVRLISSLALLGYVSSQGYFEEHHMAPAATSNNIPKHFEIRDTNPVHTVQQFEKYAKHIHKLAKQDNITIVYKIKVDILNKQKSKSNMKKIMNKIKAKKYNVPLKRNSMKLSNFEVFLRKAAEENIHYPQSGGMINYHITSTPQPQITTKILRTKFKPIISKIKNFTKIIRPVRNRIITLA